MFKISERGMTIKQWWATSDGRGEWRALDYRDAGPEQYAPPEPLEPLENGAARRVRR